ncbi:DUF2382 domain-containing protein [Rhizobium cauense]|uniref:DUF2382 domain-containing protein n=1 Tax=Rhizobium cauense TaxID=1166683 RepID=UPI001C6F295B|nr:DUF2382 domain-containing protein [Rhizobium cauense]
MHDNKLKLGVTEEKLSVDKELVADGCVEVRTRTCKVHEDLLLDLRRDEVDVERVRIDGFERQASQGEKSWLTCTTRTPLASVSGSSYNTLSAFFETRLVGSGERDFATERRWDWQRFHSFPSRLRKR